LLVAQSLGHAPWHRYQATGLSYKDVRLCVDEAEALGVPMVVGAAVREMTKLLEERAGVEIRG
jgi:hypothetical protein